MAKQVPSYTGTLRNHSLTIPACVSECSGIRIFGRRIKSLVFSTDVAIIKNINADAVIAVYPFTPQPAITQAILSVSEVPVFAGVGGGLTNGQRSASIAAYAEHQGAFGLVCNTFITEEAIRAIKETVEIPLVYTVVSEQADVAGKLAAGVDFLNVSGAARTPRSWPISGSSSRRCLSSLPVGRRTTLSGLPSRLGPMPSPTRRPPAPSCFPRVCGNTGAGLRKGLRRSRKMKGSAPTRQAGGC